MDNDGITKLMVEKSNRVQTTQEWVTDILREAILSGYYSDGKPLETTSLAKTLGVSRMPIRSALLQLENEGLVLLEPHKKAVATKLSAREFHQLCEIRCEMEALSIRYVINSIQDNEIKELHKLINKMETSSPSEFIKYNKEFHRKLNQISRNKILENIIDQLRNNVDRYLRLYVSRENSKDKIKKGNEDHRNILKAIEEKDSDMAERLIKEHLTDTSTGVAKILENIPENNINY